MLKQVEEPQSLLPRMAVTRVARQMAKAGSAGSHHTTPPLVPCWLCKRMVGRQKRGKQDRCRR